ncbi:hypothetical protein [Acetanaerobacterium elongatum]|uniref:Uncharacterized protein n=1 Tax=Acetanaerobacterium elongatum TaxID=258515 RepID=A0A1G9YCH9_9FIRM|nr:hypothetical protein [Acetanaerobacterium elongatum]SDN06809.1 hypothetical protein SAMN05192585_11088 [Acetanaerobacterium elongatum]
MESESMFELAEQLKELRESKKYAEQELKEINADIESTEQQLAQLMLDTETQSFNRNGTMFYLSSTVRASAVAGRKDELYTALREQGFGDLVYETVNANSLSAFVKERMSENEDALPAWLDGLVNPYEKTTVNIRNVTK